VELKAESPEKVSATVVANPVRIEIIQPRVARDELHCVDAPRSSSTRKEISAKVIEQALE
jgi:hypothetical protein